MATVAFGYGEYRYERIPRWGRLPKGWEFGKLSSVAVDSQDRVYLYQRTEHPVVVLDRDGDFLTSWGEGVIAEGHGIFIDAEDHVYLVDRQGQQVLKFSTEGKLVMALGNRGCPAREAPFNFPTGVAVGPAGEIYVCDGYGNSRVHKFSAEGELLLSWGRAGSGPGQFKVPHAAWVDSHGRVYVCDRENNRVQLFTTEGVFVAEWTDFYRPADIYMDGGGAVYVTDHIPRLSILDPAGNLLARGQSCDIPHGVWGDSRGDFYVVSYQESFVEKYVRQR